MYVSKRQMFIDHCYASDGKYYVFNKKSRAITNMLAANQSHYCAVCLPTLSTLVDVREI